MLRAGRDVVEFKGRGVGVRRRQPLRSRSHFDAGRHLRAWPGSPFAYRKADHERDSDGRRDQPGQ